MKKYKVAVYAISKNEEKFVNRWIDSMMEADEIYVLDTGSTDNTVNLLKDRGVNVVVKEINPWRFDIARNESLKIVPEDTDICVCTDLDEVFNPGWRLELEKSWNNCNHLRYTYNWSLDEFNNPLVTLDYDKIHSRNGFVWINPVHEVLKCLTDEKVNTNYDIILNHYPDNTKSRSQYLPLLELSVKEDENNLRNIHYLGREYMFHERWNDAINTLHQYLNNKNSIWKNERSASMRYIARCYQNLNLIDEAEYWYKKAIEECSDTREAYVEYALFELNNKNNYFEVVKSCLKAKMILEKNHIYTNEDYCWDSTIDDLLSISFYRLGLKDEAIYYINKALEKDKNNERLKNNKKIFESF